jgi:hypothetical protein
LKLALALLADFAIAHADGKLYVTGGGIRSLEFSTFPGTHLKLALALGFEFSAEELGTPHPVRIEAKGPGGEAVVRPAEFFLHVPADEPPPAYLNLVYNMERVVFPTEGDYIFTIIIDGKSAGEVPLRINTARLLSMLTPAAELLQTAYTAFAAGEAKTAAALIRQVTERFPNEPSAWNNLGFVLLADRQAASAKEALIRARNLGYARPEIVEANLGCAEYLLNNPRAALVSFERCIHELGFTPSALLFGIGGQELFPLELHSADDFVALMSLNAAFSARALGEESTVQSRLKRAEVTDLIHRDDTGAHQFAAAVAALSGNRAVGDGA